MGKACISPFLMLDAQDTVILWFLCYCDSFMIHDTKNWKIFPLAYMVMCLTTSPEFANNQKCIQ